MRKFGLGLLLLLASVADAKVKVVATTTDIAWATREIGGSLVEVKSLLKGTENPHYVDAVPEYIRLVAGADVVCVVGLDLEVGWMPKVLERSGNGNVQPGGKGYCETAKAITVKEKLSGPVDRSMGDVHPDGNPHYWISPEAFAEAGTAIRDVLIGVDPANAQAYLTGYAAFKNKMTAILEENRQRLAPFKAQLGKPVMLEYHKEFTYFLESYGLQSMGSLEEKPGVAPSAGRLAQVAIAAKAMNLKLVLAGDTAPKGLLERFEEMSSVPVVTVPLSLQPERGLSDYAAFQKLLVDAVVSRLKDDRVAARAGGR